ncbi:MAG: GDP-mannose 4,6-dehydratase [Pelagibacterales bacterium]|nr:GDP-mannose 4,6-dehydratase [Pelagibacterales bacterium]
MKNTKTALITGITGQDGSYLAKFLLDKNYTVYGTVRRGASEKFSRLEFLGIKDKVKFVDFDLLELSNIQQVVKDINPNEIYNLAAQSFVPTSFSLPILTSDINALGVVRLLDTILNVNKDIRFYQASTSEMFGKVQEVPQNELTRFYPRSPYGVSKLFSHYMTINYRESYDLFACSGILFNHESPLRGYEFVTKKIVSSLAKIKQGKEECLYLGNIEAQRDWGHAKDYVEAMWLMLNADTPEDYVVSSGKTTSVREFIEKTLDCLDFEYEWTGEGINNTLIDKRENKVIIKIDKKLYRPAEVDLLIGDSSKIIDRLKWSPNYNLNTLIEDMVDFEINNSKFNF